MNDNDQDDPLLDSCLQEVLGECAPPDLTTRIMAAWRSGKPTASGLKDRSSAVPRLNRQGWTIAAFAAIAALVLLGLFLRRNPRESTHSESAPSNLAASNSAVSPSPAGNESTREGSKAPTSDSPSAKQPARASSVPPVESIVAAPVAESPQPREQVPPQKPSGATASALPARKSDREVISFVNAELASRWQEAGVTPAPPASDAEWCRRLFIRVLGRIPDANDELKPFVASSAPNKRQKLVERLLSEEAYVLEYARHWSVIWSNALIGRGGGRAGSLASREGLEQYFRKALVYNKSFAEIVTELLTATGAGKPGSDDYNPAVNFLLDGLDPESTLATSRVSRVFLGQQLQCAQCHSHPSQDWSQEHYWSLNAFLRQMKAEQAGGRAKLVSATSASRTNRAGEIFYETPTGLLKAAAPRFLDGTRPDASAQEGNLDRRQALAEWIVRSEYMPRALVNRLWSHFFGYGFTRAVDDMGPITSQSDATVLNQLAQQFAAHNFDLRLAMQWIALSDAFARSSKGTSLASRDAPELGGGALFSRYYSRPMQAEEVYNSLVQSAKIRKQAGNSQELEQARVAWLAQFSRQLGDDGSGESRTSLKGNPPTIMAHGDLMRRAVSSHDGGLLKSLVQSNMKFDRKVEHLFLAALSRQPTRREQAVAAKILENGKGNEATALEDIWWAVLNSNEVILDH